MKFTGNMKFAICWGATFSMCVMIFLHAEAQTIQPEIGSGTKISADGTKIIKGSNSASNAAPHDSTGSGFSLRSSNFSHNPLSSSFSAEDEVSNLELAERDALYKRDTFLLKQLWAVDFSVGLTKTDKINFSTPGLPYYAVFIRIIEKVEYREGLVYVTGVDHTSVISAKSVEPTPHKFTHIWKMIGSTWKMVSKFPMDY